MKKLFAVLLVSFTLFGVALVAQPQPVFAKDIFTSGTSGIDCSDSANKKSAVCVEHGTQEDPVIGNNGTLKHITNIVAYVAGAAAIIVIMIGGINYIASGGDSGKVANAKNAVWYAVIGLIVIILARTLINFVINRL